jgi:hypothetical protein
MIPMAAYLCRAQCSKLKIQWREKMESKQAGDLYHTLCDMEQVLLSTFRNLEKEDMKMVEVSLLQVRYLLENSIALSTQP